MPLPPIPAIIFFAAEHLYDVKFISYFWTISQQFVKVIYKIGAEMNHFIYTQNKGQKYKFIKDYLELLNKSKFIFEKFLTFFVSCGNLGKI